MNGWLFLLLLHICIAQVYLWASRPCSYGMAVGIANLTAVCGLDVMGSRALLCTSDIDITQYFPETYNVLTRTDDGTGWNTTAPVATAGTVYQQLFSLSLGRTIRVYDGSDPAGNYIITGCDRNGARIINSTCGGSYNSSSAVTITGIGGSKNGTWVYYAPGMNCSFVYRIYCVAGSFTTPGPTVAPTVAPTAAPTPPTNAPTMLPTGPQNSSLVLTSANLTATVVVPPDVLQNGTVIANITPGTNTTLSTSVISIVLQDPSGNIVNVSNLTTPVSILFALTIPMNPNAVSQCVGTLFVVEPVLPTCSYWHPNTSKWETDGCSVASFNSTHVQCNCTHFTLFGVTTPKHNKLVPDVFLDLTPSNLDAHPTGLVTVFLILAIFAIMFVVAVVIDRKEAAQYEQLKSSKQEKWKKFAAQNSKATILKQVKIAFQKRHTWFSLAFRKSGTSFRSVDRTFVTLLSAFASMSMSAFYHAEDNNNMARVGVIVISALVCAIPSQLLTLLFVRTGPMGFYEEWEQSGKPPPKHKCLAYRFPAKWRHVWRASTLIAVIAMIVYVLAMSVNFDRQPFYFCQGEAAMAWVGTWLLAYMASVLLLEPLRIVLLAVAAHYTQSLRTDVTSRVTELGSADKPNETEDQGEGD